MMTLLLGLCTVRTQAVSPTFQSYTLPPSWRLKPARYRSVYVTFWETQRWKDLSCAQSMQTGTVERYKTSLFRAMECTKNYWWMVFPPYSHQPWRWIQHVPLKHQQMCPQPHDARPNSGNNINNKPLWNLKISKLNVTKLTSLETP
jgi:hypothetical protein